MVGWRHAVTPPSGPLPNASRLARTARPRRPSLTIRHHHHAAEVALVRIRRARLDQRAHLLAGQQLDLRALELIEHVGGNADVGDHHFSDFISAGGRTSGSLGAGVTVTVASIASPIRSLVSADMPEGMSIDTIGTRFVDVGDHRLVEAGQRRRQAVPNIASMIRSWPAISAPCSSHAVSSATSTSLAEPAEDLEVDVRRL